MDNKWNALIYVILSILIFAVSVMRKKKKTVSPLDRNDERQESDNLFELLTGNQIAEPILQEKVINIMPDHKELINTKPDQVNILNNKEEERKEKVSEFEHEEGFYESEILDFEEFDLRQAVIYSEILNRKIF